MTFDPGHFDRWPVYPSLMTGCRIIEDANALEETAERLFPASRHRSARIRKKLVKRFGGEFRKAPAAFQHINGTLIVHPAIAQRIRREIAVKQEFNRTHVNPIFGGALA